MHLSEYWKLIKKTDETKATAVEILNVFAPSPPVPQVSTKSKDGSSDGVIEAFWSIFAIAESSSPETPFALNAAKNAPVWTGSILFSSHEFIK